MVKRRQTLNRERILKQMKTHKAGKSGLSARYIIYLIGELAKLKETKKKTGFERRQGQQKFSNEPTGIKIVRLESIRDNKSGKKSVTSFNYVNKRFGAFKAMQPKQKISKEGTVDIVFSGKPLEIKFRKKDIGKTVLIYEFNTAIVFVDKKNNDLLGIIKPGDVSRIKK